jgi:hypothetical protein
MHHLVFHFDPSGPEARAAFDRLPECLQGLNVEVVYRPLIRTAEAPPAVAAWMAWALAFHADGAATPGRWVCEQLFEAFTAPDAAAWRLAVEGQGGLSGAEMRPVPSLQSASAAWEALRGQAEVGLERGLPAVTWDGQSLSGLQGLDHLSHRLRADRGGG